jgi:hypothetical protein
MDPLTAVVLSLLTDLVISVETARVCLTARRDVHHELLNGADDVTTRIRFNRIARLVANSDRGARILNFVAR